MDHDNEWEEGRDDVCSGPGTGVEGWERRGVLGAMLECGRGGKARRGVCG